MLFSRRASIADRQGRGRETLSRVLGILNAANRRTGTFEIDLGDEGTVSGRVAHPILEGVTIGGRYEFKLSQVVTKDMHTGQLDASWSLLEVRDGQE